MEKIKTREKVDPALSWDLAKLYPDDEAWEKEFASLEKLLEKFLAFKGRLKESPETLRDAYKASDDFEMVLDRLFTYAHLKSDEDTTNSANKARLDRISEKAAVFSAQCAWFSPELSSMDEKTFEKFRRHKSLAFYKRSLDNEARYRPHILSSPEEKILARSGNVLGASSGIFSAFNDADLRFPSIRDAKGGKTEVTHGNYITLMQSPLRRVRKSAFQALHGTFRAFRNTLSSTLYANTKKNILLAELRNIGSARSASLFSDNIPLSVYDSLIDAVHEKIGYLHRYMKIRARELSLRKLDMYDIYNPLIPECDERVTWPEAVRYVKEALAPLGKEYGRIVEKAFSERWMDVEENRGKRSGAYSGGCYGSLPYILMTFKGDLNSVSTLAHEMGHSIHSFLSHASQPYHYAYYRIFVAEVASTTNEILLHEYLMKNAPSDKVRAYLLNQLLDEVRGTLFRQTMFAEFEREIYDEAAGGVPLTADKLDEIYYNLNTFYYGKSVKADKLIASEWSRIPHFYRSFYVYKYATGFSAAVALSRNILAGNTEAYLDFLKAGGSKDVLDIMKDAGVDFTTRAPVVAALEYFNERLSAFDRILKKKDGK
ncbi:MAG: oligoendopeptidase F [Lentisphaeria bacterium]|nr:oligoendopeptidase F [Lentisphaeria bacterium]